MSKKLFLEYPFASCIGIIVGLISSIYIFIAFIYFLFSQFGEF